MCNSQGHFDDYSGQVVFKEMIGEDICLLRLQCPQIASSAGPGQFVLLRDPRWGSYPLLMRPFAVAGVKGDAIEVLFKVLPNGKGTKLLSDTVEGDEIIIRGPMGRGFIEKEGKKAYIAGTLGVAPLLFAIDRFGDGLFILGVPGKGWEDFASWVKSSHPQVKIYSDDGEIGEKGNSLNGLEGENLSDSHVIACGPNGMLAALAPLNLSSCEVSLEKRMACGMGACCGCVVNTTSGKKRACVDGPVFDLKEVIWND